MYNQVKMPMPSLPSLPIAINYYITVLYDDQASRQSRQTPGSVIQLPYDRVLGEHPASGNRFLSAS